MLRSVHQSSCSAYENLRVAVPERASEIPGVPTPARRLQTAQEL